jgi:hypothetical protein
MVVVCRWRPARDARPENGYAATAPFPRPERYALGKLVVYKARLEGQ